jgi:hypothetical protein
MQLAFRVEAADASGGDIWAKMKGWRLSGGLTAIMLDRG